MIFFLPAQRASKRSLTAALSWKNNGMASFSGIFLWLVFAAVAFSLSGCQAISAVLVPPTPEIQTSPTVVNNLPPPPAQLGDTATPYINTTPTITPYPSETPTPTGIPIGVLQYPPGVDPLTGLTVDDPQKLERLPVMVKVANYPRYGRPHAGLSFADIVFEYYIGEGFNRFLAIFYGKDAPQVGPVRSGRLVDAQLGDMYRGILVYGNADAQVDNVLIDKLGKRLLAAKDSPCPPVCGEDTHSVAGVFADTAAVTDYARQHGLYASQRSNLYGMIFDEVPPKSDVFAVQVAIQFGVIDRGEWRYDPQTRSYLRWIEEDRIGDEWKMIPLVDRVNNQQLAFANIIVLFPKYTTYAPTLHNIALLTNQYGQPAVFFRDGLMYEGSWRVPQIERPMQFFNEYGLPMQLKPGNTWIVLASPESTFGEVKPGEWEMKFDIPLPTETPIPTSTPGG